MQKRVKLPQDELPHKKTAIEWWYFNGFLEGVKSKNKYAFMTCLFQTNTKKVNLNFFKIPIKTLYFSHTLLFNLQTGKITKEIIPFAILSDDSFKRKDLFVNYTYPLRTKFSDYEISRQDKNILRVKTDYFDLLMKEEKKPLYENKTGFIQFDKKSTYYYTLPNLKAEGYVGKEKVSGKAWMDKQWSYQGFMRDSWLWFSIQLENKTEIICCDYKGTKFATISYPDNHQESLIPEFTPIGECWKSKESKINYNLGWKIKIKNMIIETKPLIRNCEMNFGPIHYWEGPLNLKVNGKAQKNSQGFMEYLAEPADFSPKDFVYHKIDWADENIKKALKKLKI